jgi:hypothetical protein
MTIKKIINLCGKRFLVKHEYRKKWSQTHDVDKKDNWIVTGNEVLTLSAYWNKNTSEILAELDEIEA